MQKTPIKNTLILLSTLNLATCGESSAHKPIPLKTSQESTYQLQKTSVRDSRCEFAEILRGECFLNSDPSVIRPPRNIDEGMSGGLPEIYFFEPKKIEEGVIKESDAYDIKTIMEEAETL